MSDSFIELMVWVVPSL